MKMLEKLVADMINSLHRSKNIAHYETALKLNNELVENAILISELEAKLATVKASYQDSLRSLSQRFDELEAQSNATIREMGEKIDADAALAVSFREMPFVCFADDPHAAIAAIVKADVDGAPVDWTMWPAGV